MKLLFLTGLALTLGSASAPSPPPPGQTAASANPPGIRILSDVALPPAFRRATDVRWASDETVYLGVSADGTFEVSLDPAGPPPKEMIAGRSKPEGYWISKIAASTEYLAAVGPAQAVTWRRLSDPTSLEARFASIQSIDLKDNRLAILGARRNEDGGSDDALAWIGSLDQERPEFRPILRSSVGSSTRDRVLCEKAPVGALRFLPEGSLLIVPATQAGASLYDGKGNLIRDWSAQALGIDSLCGVFDGSRANEVMDSGPLDAQINRWRTVDTLLPFPGGPGLVVRRVENGRTRWDLKILKLDGTAESFPLPFEGASEFFHLQGDVRGGKVVFVLYETAFDGSEKERPELPRLIVAERTMPEIPPPPQRVRRPEIPRAAAQPLPASAPIVVASPPPTPTSQGTRAGIGINVLSDTALPPAFEWASDVRWASDESVYLGVGFVGTFEVGLLDSTGSPPKEMIGGRSKPGGFWAATHVAASSKYLAVAGPAMSVTWRKIADPTREEEAFDFVQSIDVQENRLAVLGARRDEKGDYGTDGSIAWIGTLDKRLADLQPVLYDISGPGTRNMGRCGSGSVGALRFLPDGSLLVAPGVQAGVSLYDDGARLIRTWDSASLGIDAVCGSMTDDDQAHRIMSPAASRNIWLNQWRTVDTVLPLPGGPALVVRNAEKGHTHWDLKILKLDGTAKSFALPFEGNSEFFHLKGDVRAGKIVFVLYETVFNGGEKSRPTPPRLIVAESPAIVN